MTFEKRLHTVPVGLPPHRTEIDPRLKLRSGLLMESRRAYTAGAMVVSVGVGLVRSVPAGICRIDRDPATPDVYTVRWIEGGIERSGQLLRDVMRVHLLGCIVQYA